MDVETGETYINWDQVFKQDGDEKMVCFQNSRGYWPLAYHPGENALYVPYHDECVVRSIDMSRERWDAAQRLDDDELDRWRLAIGEKLDL